MEAKRATLLVLADLNNKSIVLLKFFWKSTLGLYIAFGWGIAVRVFDTPTNDTITTTTLKQYQLGGRGRVDLPVGVR